MQDLPCKTGARGELPCYSAGIAVFNPERPALDVAAGDRALQFASDAADPLMIYVEPGVDDAETLYGPPITDL